MSCIQEGFEPAREFRKAVQMQIIQLTGETIPPDDTEVWDLRAVRGDVSYLDLRTLRTCPDPNNDLPTNDFSMLTYRSEVDFGGKGWLNTTLRVFAHEGELHKCISQDTVGKHPSHTEHTKAIISDVEGLVMVGLAHLVVPPPLSPAELYDLRIGPSEQDRLVSIVTQLINTTGSGAPTTPSIGLADNPVFTTSIGAQPHAGSLYIGNTRTTPFEM